jgi:hypothetical protein
MRISGFAKIITGDVYEILAVDTDGINPELRTIFQAVHDGEDHYRIKNIYYTEDEFKDIWFILRAAMTYSNTIYELYYYLFNHKSSYNWSEMLE